MLGNSQSLLNVHDKMRERGKISCSSGFQVCLCVCVSKLTFITVHHDDLA